MLRGLVPTAFQAGVRLLCPAQRGGSAALVVARGFAAHPRRFDPEAPAATLPPPGVDRPRLGQFTDDYPDTVALFQEGEEARLRIKVQAAKSLHDLLGQHKEVPSQYQHLFLNDIADYGDKQALAQLGEDGRRLVQCMNAVYDRQYRAVLAPEPHIFTPPREYLVEDMVQQLFAMLGLAGPKLSLCRWPHQSQLAVGKAQFWAIPDFQVKQVAPGVEDGRIGLVDLEIEDDHRRRSAHRQGETKLVLDMLAAAQQNSQKGYAGGAVFGVRVEMDQFQFYALTAPPQYLKDLELANVPSVDLVVQKFPESTSGTPTAPHMHTRGWGLRIPSQRRRIVTALYNIADILQRA